MTTLNRANIPAAINTVERLMVWCAQVLQNTSSPDRVVVESNEPAQPRCVVNQAVLANNEPTFCVSAFIPLELSALNSSSAKTWMSAKEISTAAAHSNFNAD